MLLPLKRTRSLSLSLSVRALCRSTLTGTRRDMSLSLSLPPPRGAEPHACAAHVTYRQLEYILLCESQTCKDHLKYFRSNREYWHVGTCSIGVIDYQINRQYFPDKVWQFWCSEPSAKKLVKINLKIKLKINLSLTLNSELWLFLQIYFFFYESWEKKKEEELKSLILFCYISKSVL